MTITVMEYLTQEKWKATVPPGLPAGKVYPSLIVMALSMTRDDAQARTSPRLFQTNGVLLADIDNPEQIGPDNTSGQVWAEVVDNEGAILYLKARPVELFGVNEIDREGLDFEGVIKASMGALVDWLEQFDIKVPPYIKDHILKLEAILMQFDVRWINDAKREPI